MFKHLVSADEIAPTSTFDRMGSSLRNDWSTSRMAADNDTATIFRAPAASRSVPPPDPPWDAAGGGDRENFACDSWGSKFMTMPRYFWKSWVSVSMLLSTCADIKSVVSISR